jgi:Zn-dependent oligopeptidase
MTFNWNPTKNDLIKMSKTIIERIDIIYNSISNKPNIISFLRQENIIFSNIYNYFSFIHDITDKIEIKKICNNILEIIILKKKELFTDIKIFNKLNEIIKTTNKMTYEDARFLKYILKEFKEKGIYLKKEEKIVLLEINNKINKYQNIFLHNLDMEPKITLKKENIIGLDESFLIQYKVNEEYIIKLNEHTYNYLIENLEFSEVRKILQTTFFKYYTNNYINLEKILVNRFKLAKIFGYNNYIDYINNDQTLNSRKKILSFLYNLNNSMKIQYEKDIINICDFFNIQKVNNIYLLNGSDIPYLIHNYKNKK